MNIISKDCYYFSHDSNAKDDPKCVLMIEQMGLEGFGIYWVLIEILRDQPTYRYPIALIPAIARRYNTTAEKMKIVVCGYGLFAIDEDEFFSVSLMNRMGKMNEIKEKRSIAGKKSAEKRLMIADISTNVEQVLNKQSTNVEQVKESKVKESKVNIVINNYTADADLIESINSFIEMRKSLKKPMTERAIKMMFKKLDGLSSDDAVKSEILNQSTMSSWTDIYELKQQKLFKPQQPKQSKADQDMEELGRMMADYDRCNAQKDTGSMPCQLPRL